MVDNFSDLTYLHLMISTIQEDNLEGKVDFERWDSTFGVKVKIYHADNGQFSEQPFRSSIEDANQTITFCGVGYHHQNAIFEIKIQTITLGYTTLPLHAKNIFTRFNNYNVI